MFEADPRGKKFGPLWFTPGVTGINASASMFASFSTISLITFMGFVQPYLLTEVLKIPAEQQGTITGQLAAMQEVVVILLMSFIGAASDSLGRRRVFVAGFIMEAAAYILYPFATSITELFVYRMFFAVGAAITPIMLSACIVDYVQEVSRARWIGVSSVCSGLGVLFMSLVLTRSPEFFQGFGATPEEAGRYAYWTAAALCVLSAIILARGLQGHTKPSEKPAPLLTQVKLGMAAGLENPRLALAYVAAFVGRGDLVIIATFFSLWIVQSGTEAGLATDESLTRAGMLFGILQTAALLWAVFMGMIADRMNRITALVIALFLCGSGYFAMSLIEDPLNGPVIPVSILLGMGEVSVIIAAGALMGQEAKQAIRGAIVGVYGLTGAFGILFATSVGGVIFDEIGKTAPFAMMGILNLTLMVVALAMRFSRHAAPEQRVSEEAA